MNNEKSKALMRTFFPPKPQDNNDQEGHKYPQACCAPDKMTKAQIERQLRKLKPYKAPGPDGIPNVILTKCANLLLDRLYHIYKGMLECNLQYKPWKTFTTVVLRKLGKPRYDVPKAYRPIALLNTMWKVLMAIVAEQITYYTEKYQLLPSHHFGGRPGRTTTDAMHLLAHRIKGAWRKGKVAAVLFLDIEGAFPNAVLEKLIHNLRKCKIPLKHVEFVKNMLRGRLTTLRFNGYCSEQILIDNGTGQGDLLSMVLYQYYNADLLDIPDDNSDTAVAYVDDTLLYTEVDTFEEAHLKLAKMMTKENGVAKWSKEHNSPLEYSKLALIDFAHHSNPRKPNPLQLLLREVKPSNSARYLGVIFDHNLNWKAQHVHTVKKGAKWAAQIRRITRSSWGITPKYTRCLFISVALPRIQYAVDLWCTPVDKTHARPKGRGLAKVTKQITIIQRAAALAITGGLKTSLNDTLNFCAFLPPTALTINKWCFRAYIRMLMLLKEHPLHRIVTRKNNYNTK